MTRLLVFPANHRQHKHIGSYGGCLCSVLLPSTCTPGRLCFWVPIFLSICIPDRLSLQSCVRCCQILLGLLPGCLRQHLVAAAHADPPVFEGCPGCDDEE